MSELGISILIPCYNERNAIADSIEQLSRLCDQLDRPCELIVVDDASTDGSAELVDRDKARLIRHETNRGYGAALKTGARQAKHDILVIVDADGTYPFDQIGRLLEALDGVDMVVGARTGANVHIPVVRRPAKWALRKLANYLTETTIPDLNSGFRVIHRRLWERYERYFPDGFSLTTTITLAALTNDYSVRYVPIDYHERIGASKIRPIRDTIGFVQLILRTVLYFDPLKIFVPISLILILASLVVGVTTKLMGEFMDTTTSMLFVTGLQLLAIGALADLISKRIP